MRGCGKKTSRDFICESGVARIKRKGGDREVRASTPEETAERGEGSEAFMGNHNP